VDMILSSSLLDEDDEEVEAEAEEELMVAFWNVNNIVC